MTALYQLTGNILELSRIASDDSTDEQLAEALQETMNANELEFNDKAVGIVHVANALSSNTVAIDDEIKRLTARKKAIENRKTQIVEYLRINMEASNITKIECPLFTITLRKGVDVVHLVDEKLLPDEYINIKTVISPDKREILKHLKAGEHIPGAEIAKGKTSLLIK